MGMMKGNKRTISFKDQEHEMFYRNFLQNCKSGDAYHKALAYCIGINGDTANPRYAPVRTWTTPLCPMRRSSPLPLGMFI